MTDFDTLWKFEALKLSAMEQLEVQGNYGLPNLFERAKQIYNEGYENKINSWASLWNEKGEVGPAPSEIKEESPALVSVVEMPAEGTKQCPKCQEFVPEGWGKHVYKKDQTKCGHVFL